MIEFKVQRKAGKRSSRKKDPGLYRAEFGLGKLCAKFLGKLPKGKGEREVWLI